jgi:hypothetical protein
MGQAKMSDRDIEAIELAARRAAARQGHTPAYKNALIAIADEIANLLRERRHDQQKRKYIPKGQEILAVFVNYREVEEFIEELRNQAANKWPDEAQFYQNSQRDE